MKHYIKDTEYDRVNFLSKHIGQPVIWYNKIKGFLVGVDTSKVLLDLKVLEEMDNNTPVYKDWCSGDTALLVKPLTNLSSAEVFIISKILNVTDTNELKENIIEILSDSNRVTANTFVNFAAVIDLLRGWNYPVPYMGVSVSELIEWGWYKVEGE